MAPIKQQNKIYLTIACVFVVNFVTAILYFMLPWHNAPKNLWTGKTLQLIALLDKKVMICSTILLIELYMLTFYLVKNSVESLMSYITVAFLAFIIIFLLVNYIASEMLDAFT